MKHWRVILELRLTQKIMKEIIAWLMATMVAMFGALPSHINIENAIAPDPVIVAPVSAPVVVEQPAPVKSIKKSVAKKEVKKSLLEIVGVEITYDNILNGVNLERAKVGARPLIVSEELNSVAQRKLADMLKYGYWGHDNPITGQKFPTWFLGDDGFYHYNSVGENLARYFPTVQQTIVGWVSSPTHYHVLSGEQFWETGIAISGNLVVQEFGGRGNPDNYLPEKE
jgi:uncharacterized protein YkwD